MVFEKICDKLNIPDCRRFRWFFWILVFSLLSLVAFYIFKEKFFYQAVTIGTNNIYRFFWILPFSFMGFAFLAFGYAKDGSSKDDNPWGSYLFGYFPKLIAFSLIIFSSLNLFESTSTYIYYFFSAGLGLYTGNNIDAIQLEKIFAKNR